MEMRQTSDPYSRFELYYIELPGFSWLTHLALLGVEMKQEQFLFQCYTVSRHSFGNCSMFLDYPWEMI